MKKKTFLFSLFVFMFGLCGTLGYFGFQESFTYAQSSDASVWDGNYVTDENSLSENDWYNDGNRFYYIRSAKGFSYFSYLVNKDSGFQSFLNKTITLETDIDLNGHNFLPIGYGSNIFRGNFNGNGHYIYNLTIDNANMDSNFTFRESGRTFELSIDTRYVGLFGILTDNSIVKNLHIRNLEIEINDVAGLSGVKPELYIGGMVGNYQNTSDSNLSLTYMRECSVKGQIKTNFLNRYVYNIGGLIGNAQKILVTNSMADVDIYSVNENKVSLGQRIGGFVGSANYVNFESCFSEGNITASTGAIGGIVGYATGIDSSKLFSLSNCYNSGKIEVSDITWTRAGGLVGLIGKSDAYSFFKINCSYNSGNIQYTCNLTSSDKTIFSFGGLISYVDNANTLYSSLKNSFMVGDIGLFKNNVFTKENDGVNNVSYLYNKDVNTSNFQTSHLFFNVEERFTTSPDSAVVNLINLVKTKDFFSNVRFWSEADGWDFSIWKIDYGVNNGMPYLINAYNIGNPNNDSDYSGESTVKGTGTLNDPYLIETAGDLGWVSFNYSEDSGISRKETKYYSLQNDINLIGKTWQPIGSAGTPFNGVFNGNGHVISGITCSMQEKFGYHGLFGVAENAVIKNLIVRDIMFINGGSESEDTDVKGAIIGLAQGNVYLINCTDRSAVNNLYTVGKVNSDSNLFAVYGVNNITLSGSINADSIKLTGTEISDGSAIKTGYDVIIGGKGGNFYNSDIDLYTGEYHIMILNNNADDTQTDNFIILQPADKNGNIIDNSFGKNYLPKLSTSYGEKDILIRRGFRLSGYKYTASNEWVGGDNYSSLGENGDKCYFDLGNNPVKGIYAVWEKEVETITVVYNRYESENFGITSVNPTADSIWKLANTDDETRNLKKGDVYVEYLLDYDSFIYDYPELYTSPKNYDNKYLRGKDFQIKSIYTSFTTDIKTTIDTSTGKDAGVKGIFEDKDKLSSNSLINDNLTKTFFAEWEGRNKKVDSDDEEDYQKYPITITFTNGRTTPGNEDERFARDFELKDALQSISMTKHYTAGKDFSEDTDVSGGTFTSFEQNSDSDKRISVNFDYDTRLSSSANNYFSFDLQLNRGYSFTSPINYESSANDTNYGNLKFGPLKSSPSSDNAENFSNVRFLNLVGEYEIVIDLHRNTNERDVVLGNGVYFGLSPMIEKYSDVWVKNAGGFERLESALTPENFSNLSGYIGYDFFKNTFVSSDKKYSSDCKLPDSYILKEGDKQVVYLRYDIEEAGITSYRYFIYEKYSKVVNEKETIFVEFYEAKNTNTGTNSLESPILVKDKYIITISEEYLGEGVDAPKAQIKFLSNSTFQFIFSTEMDDMVFSNTTIPNVYYKDSTISQTLEAKPIKYLELNGETKYTKISMNFNKIYGFIETESDIWASTYFTRAIFNFVAVDASGNIITKNAPKFKFATNVYDIVSSRNILFDVYSTDYYEFNSGRNSGDINGSVRLYKDSNYNIKITASNVNTNTTEDAAKNWADTFNLDNSIYFKDVYIEGIAGSQNAKVIYNQRSEDNFSDYYSVSMPFFGHGSEENPNPYALMAGMYNVEVYCKNVEYSINYANKFISYSNYNASNTSESFFATFDESESKVQTAISVNGIDYVGSELTTITYPNNDTAVPKGYAVHVGQETILYGDNIQAKTNLGDNYGYTFFKWYIKAENYGGYISNEKQLNFFYNEKYRGNQNELSSNRYNITLFAVYIRKEVNVGITKEVLVVDENGNTGTTKYNASALGLENKMYYKESETQKKSITNANYQYTSVNQAGITSLSNLSLGIDGTNAVGYYMYGYRLVDKYGETILDINETGYDDQTKVSVCDNIDLYILLKQMLENNVDNPNPNLLTQTFYLLPMIKQKTATLYFYSGTGVDAPYGEDKRDGLVYDLDGQLTTDTIAQIKHAYMGNTFSMNGPNDVFIGDSEMSDRMTVNSIFATRTGYSSPSNNYWKSHERGKDFKINGNQIDLTYEYFSSGTVSVELHFYRVWTPNKYTITFRPNGGKFDSSIDYMNMTVVYDSGTLTGNKPVAKKTGYDLAGWSYVNGEINEQIFDKDLKLVPEDGNNILFKNKVYKNDGDTELFAIWEAKTYEFEIKFNSANSVNGTTILNDEKDDFGIIYSIRYEHSFAELTDKDNNILKISDILPERLGYTFNGIYAVYGNRRERISDETIFDMYLLSVNINYTPVLTLFVDWEFNRDFVSLTINNMSLPSLTYEAKEKTIFLKQYFQDSNYVSKGYIISVVGNELKITLPEETGAEVILTLTSTTATVANARDTHFSVRDYGKYVVNFNIAVVDNAKYLNKGNISSVDFQFNINVEKANVDKLVSDAINLQNVKRIMNPFLDTQNRTEISSCSTFEEFATLMKVKDTTIMDASNMEIYNYVMIKYYFLTTTNVGTEHKKYKEWKYANYLEYISEENVPEQVNQILSSINYFDFYKYSNTTNLYEISGYNSIEIASEQVENVLSEIKIDKIVMYTSEGGEFVPNNIYEIRLYLKNTISGLEKLQNYNLLYDENGLAYIKIGTGYLMPQMLSIENKESVKTVYFSSGLVAREVAWKGNRVSIVYEGKTYYFVEDNYYVAADLFTSNGGNKDIDTNYAFKNESNYLFFNNVSIIKQTSGATPYIDVTSRFKLVMEESDIFTILNTNGIASISLSANYLTKVDGILSFDKVDNTMATELLRITSVSYNFDGTEKTSYNANGLPTGAFSDNGVMIYEINTNNSNTVSLFINKTVTNIVFTTMSNSLNDYIKLYKWSNSEIYNIDGTMEKQGSFTLSKDDLILSDAGLVETNYYAVYTDLVLVNYIFNLPSSYNPVSSTSTILKLGASTINDLSLPNEEGFVVSAVRAKLPSGETVDYSNIFTGNDSGNGKVFIGIDRNSPHTPVSLDIKWAVNNIEYFQLMENYKTAVQSFDKLLLSDVVMLQNKNTNIYNYEYVWSFNGTIISKGESLILPNKGSYEESGQYTLLIKATLKPEFVSSLEDASAKTSTSEIVFNLEFVKNFVQSITLPTAENSQTNYDNREHIKDWSVKVDYFVYDRFTDEYSEEATSQQLYYITTGSVYFKVFFNGTEVGSMKNAGQYRVLICFDEGMFTFDTSISEADKEFMYTINSVSVDLSTYNFTGSKVFNSVEPSLDREVFLSNENVTLSLKRDAGENVGDYNIYFKDILQDYKKNYIFKFGDVVLFENGILTTAGRTTTIGKFTINPSGTLRLSYSATPTLPQNIQAPYSKNGYSLVLTNDFKLQIFNGAVLYKEFALLIYDVSSGNNVTSIEILNILKTKLNDISPKFYNAESLTEVFNSLSYTYKFDIGSEFSKYYTNVEFANGFTFEIGRVVIDVSAFDFNKQYDGKNIVYMDTEGNIIDLATYSGIYVSGLYSTSHAGDNIRVELNYLAKNTSENIANYSLSATNSIAKISKIDGTMSISMSKYQYSYGEVSVNKLSNLISNYEIIGSDGLNKNDLLVSGFYEISYNLANDVLKNDRGFVYKGNYQLEAAATFQDFNMTLVMPTFEIVAMNYEKIIAESYIVVTVLDEVKDFYEESITIAETGDIITLQYNVQGLTAGEKPAVGQYDLGLKANSFLAGSINVNLNANNKGFEVLFATDTLYMRFEDVSILTQIYNGINFVVSTDALSKQIIITNGVNTFTSGFTFFTKSESGEVPVSSDLVSFHTLSIYNSVDTTQFKNAGNYKLNLNAVSNEYTNVVFDREYYFVINKLNIDITQFTFEKTYDAEMTYSIDEFNEKISGDNVVIYVKFEDSNAGTNKVVSIYLEGLESGNYKLSGSSSKGTINKADATVTLKQSEFEYGKITDKNNPDFSVKSNGIELLSSQYTIRFTTALANYSALGYLQIGNYTISLESVISRNYQISMVATSINITPFNLNMVFNTNGGYRTTFGSVEANTNTFVYKYLTTLYEEVQLNLQRETGSEVGYYKVLSGTSNNSNYNIASVQDTSDLGYFRINMAEDWLYLLLSSQDILDGGLSGTEINIEYDSNLYDTAFVEERSIGLYRLVLTNSTDASIRLQYDLNYYTFDSNTNTYTKKDVLVNGLTTNLRFLNPTQVKNIGSYDLMASDTESGNYEVRMGKAGEQYCFHLNISKRQLYFKETTLRKVFDNKDATFIYEDATELLENILENETLGINVQFTKNGSIVKYAGVNYDVVASIFGLTSDNYELNMTTSDSTGVKALISRADMLFIINNQTFTYGEDIDLVYQYSTEVDITGYDSTRLSFSLVVDARSESTSGALKVGEYNLLLYFVADDFNISGYLVNNEEKTDLTAKVIVEPKKLELVQKTETLKNIFTKVYDETNSVKILGEDGNLLFDISGIHSSNLGISDSVTIASASYANEYIGQNIEVRFILSGEDRTNYILPSWAFGIIEPVVINLNFDYKADGSNVTSNVDDNRLQTLSQIAYPFMSTSYLTSNSLISATSSTKNFPTSLTGKTGFTFTYWTMDFAGVDLGSEKLNYLNALVNALGIESFHVGNVYSVRVDNGEKTVRFLSALIQDDKDLFGLYYKTNNDIQITFNAKWNTNKYRVTLQIADENGKNASLGSVEVDDEDNGTTNSIVTNNYLGEFSYDAPLTLRASANQHCNFYGFYTSDGKLLTGTEPYITISKEGDINILRVSNVRQSYNFVVRYIVQRVNVVLDFSDYDDVTISSSDFVSIGNKKFQWTTDYLTLDNLYLASLPEIHRTGFEVASLSTQSTTILQENFATTKITSLLPNSHEEILTLNLKPNFQPVGISVVLDFGYDNRTQNISVHYGQKYNTSTDWIETPEREGYAFLGWFNSSEVRIYGTDTMNTTQSHTLTAKWEIKKYSLELGSPNSIVTDANVVFVQIGNTYVANEIEYGSVVTFKVFAKTGFEISASWATGFVVVINADGSANVTLTMPAMNYDYDLPIVPLQNHVAITGNRIDTIRAYDITETETELVVSNKMFSLSTGRRVRIVVTAVSGYYVTEEIHFDDGYGLDVTTRYENGAIVIEIVGINKDVEIQLTTAESKNRITVAFDNPSRVSVAEINDVTYNNVSMLPLFEATTNSIFTIYVKFVHGFMLNNYSSEQFTISHELITEGAYKDYYKIELSDISTDGRIDITSTVAKFTLTMEVISYDENKNRVDISGNKAYANGFESVEVDFNTQVMLTTLEANLYSFAGWSRDGVSVFSTVSPLNYLVTGNETIYAIFSTLKFDITLATYNYYTIYNEYNNPSLVQSIYSEISGGKYYDIDTDQQISKLELYYGANKSIKFKVPTGYMYYGFGYKNSANKFVYLSVEENIDEMVEVNISSLLFDETMTDLKLYMVVKAYSISLNIESKIDIDGVREPDADGVGKLNIQAQNGDPVNRYGYIDGTRVHYSSEDFVGESLLDARKFEVVAYTGDIVYLKVRIAKAGYKFDSVVANRQDISINKLVENEDYILFEIANLVGGHGEIEIDVLFKPFLNIINMSFLNNNIKVDGGIFTFNIDDANIRKIWTSGREYSSVVVSAYTGSYFEVSAFIRAGFNVKEDNLQITDVDGLIVEGSLTYQSLSIVDSGFTGKITFVVADYLGVHNIDIGVSPTKYKVLLKEENETLVSIKNVSFNSALNLTQNNADNISILDNRILYENGKLKLDLKKTNFNFEGYFSYQNGAGVQYVNSNGEAVNSWKESGYVLNQLTSKYQLSDNAEINPETGEVVISIYLYWSYLKTRISFEFVPGISTKYTAQDMVTGVDYTNSWFYDTAPLYIEVSFNTDIHIKAPNISGYKFYKFVISQKNAGGTWLSDVSSFSDDVPWTTNEFDRIVECKVKVIYFAQIEVTTFGGDATFKFAQESDDNQAKTLLQQGYVDTSKPFSIEAIESDGYQFLRWVNSSTGQSTFTKIMTLTVNKKTTLVMNLQGLPITLNFADYNSTFGQIVTVKTESRDNSFKTYSMGRYGADGFIKQLLEIDVKVGDRITFALAIDYGFGVSWNRTDITFVEYKDNLYYFTMSALSADALKGLKIIPTFKDTVLSIFISSDFVESDKQENTIDMNVVSMAGYTMFNGRKTNFVSSPNNQEVRISAVANSRYEIASIKIKNYNNIFDDMSEFFNEEGEIVLTSEYLSSKNIVGNIQILIEYRRLLWKNDLLETNTFEGDGTTRNPYQINTNEDLILFMNYVNSGKTNAQGIRYNDASYILNADLDIGEKFWTPIGTSVYKFNGRFNFNQHKISNIYTAYFYDIVSYNGLFGVLGLNAEILENEVSLWYVYLIVAIVVVLVILLILLLYFNKRRKKIRDTMAKR